MNPPSHRPRLMFVLGMEPTKLGGVENFLRHLVLRLNDIGWDSVLCFDGAISEEFERFFDFPFVKLETVSNQGGLGHAAVSQLWRLLRKYRPRSFVYAFHSPLRLFPWIARLNGCKRIFYNDHSSRAQGMVAKPFSFPKKILGRMLTAPIDCIVSVAQFTKQTQQTFGFTYARNIVVTNGIEVAALEPDKGAAFRNRYEIATSAVVVGQVCWMVPVKGVDVMLRAAQIVLRQAPETHFVFVGGGANLEDYRSQAESMGVGSSVTFTGIVSEPLKNGVLDAFDIYGQPSRWQEACPLAVLEAMSKKLPVVASQTGGLPELVDEGSTGYLFPVEDHDRLALLLLQLIGAPELRRRMGEAGRASVLSTHRIEDMVNRYVDTLTI